MNGQTANDFVRALRFHLADPTRGHSVEPADMAHMDADALNQRHITAHRTGEYMEPEHNLPETLHHFLPKPDPDATQVMPTVDGAGEPSPWASQLIQWWADLRQHLEVHHGIGTDVYGWDGKTMAQRHADTHHANPDGDGLWQHDPSLEPQVSHLHIFDSDSGQQRMPLRVKGVREEPGGLVVDVVRDAPASNDAPVAEVAEYRGGKPVNLAAVIERLSALDVDLSEHYRRMRTLEQDVPALGRAMMRDMSKLLGRIERVENRWPATPATLDTHALSQVRGLLSEALAGLGALSYRHTATAGWPERGTARAESVVRTLHRMAAMLDGMATPEPERPLSLCQCRGIANGPNGQRIIHEIGCSYFQGEV